MAPIASFRRRLLGAACLIILLPLATFATQEGPTIAKSPLQFGQTYTGTGFASGTIQLNSSATPKVAYLQFKVSGLRSSRDPSITPYPYIRYQRVTKAEFIMELKSGQSGITGKTFQAWASDNFNTSPPSFIPNQTGAAKLGADFTVPGASTVEVKFDVTDYITGEGVYSFYVKTINSTTNVDFWGSSAGSSAPRLLLTLEDGFEVDMTPLPSKLNEQGDAVRSRYGSPWELNNLGIIDVTKQPYNATGSDATDDLLAIQRAVNDAQRARLIVYIPAGTFTISDTLNCETPNVKSDEWVPPVGSIGSQDHEFASRQDYPVVIRGSGSSSIIKLSPSDPASFNSATYPKPAIYMWSRDDATGIGDFHVNTHASNFNHCLMNLRIDATSGGAGTVGASVPGAQGIRISELTIDLAAGGFAGLVGLPGPGGITHNVTVNGGKYGIFTGRSTVSFSDSYTGESMTGYTSLLEFCKFNNQSEESVVWAGGGAMTLVGCQLLNGKGIRSNPGTRPFNGTLNVIDSYITLNGSASVAAIRGPRNVYLKNVYVGRGTSGLPDIVSITAVAEEVPPSVPATTPITLAFVGTGVSKVTEWVGTVKVDQGPFTPLNAPPDAPTRTPYFIGASPSSSSITRYTNGAWSGAAVTSVSAPGSSLWDPHNWEPTPFFKNSNQFNVRSAPYNAIPDDGLDDRAAIQAAIDAAALAPAGDRNVFLPAGEYHVSAPLTLKAGVKLYGISKNYSIIKPVWDATAFDTAPEKPLIKTVVSSTDNCMIADLQLQTRISANSDVYAYQLLWQSGNGTVKDVTFDRRQMKWQKTEQLHPMVSIEHPGAGKWFGFWVNRDFADPGYRHLMVETQPSASAPLSFYGLNIEYAKVWPQAEFINCQNINIYSFKGEGNYMNMRFANSTKFRVYGLGGNSSPMSSARNKDANDNGPANNRSVLIHNCTNFLFTNQSYQQRSPYNNAGVESYDGPNSDAYDEFAGARTHPEQYTRLNEIKTDASVDTTPGNEQFGMYRRGSPH